MAPTICSDSNEVRKSTVEPMASALSVINYVGKAQKQRTTKYNTAPYATQRRVGPPKEPATNITEGKQSPPPPPMPSASPASTLASCIQRLSRVRRRQSESSCDGDCSSDETDVSREEEQDRADILQMLQENQRRMMRNRSVSISSSSGCCSSIEDSPCERSPASGFRCSTSNLADFDDDGFRDASPYPSPAPAKPVIDTRNLLEIAIKTVRLMRRNQELQAKLTELQTETDAFIASVMLNPENQNLRPQRAGNQK